MSSFYRRLLINLIPLLSVNTLFMLLTSLSVKAEESNCNCLPSATKLSLSNKVVNAGKAKFIKNSATTFTNFPLSLKKDRSIFVAVDSGPTLRRNPLDGQPQFEPKRIPLIIPQPKPRYRTAPGITIINPSGYGASWGNAGIGIGLQERVRFRDEADGVVGVGFGLGNSSKSVGLQVGISFVDLSNPWRDGTVNVKLHRRLPEDFSVAVGVQGATTWGETDGGSSVYGVTTKRFVLREDRTKPFSEIYTSVGIGGGQFRSESDINDGVESIGVFGSLAVKVAEPVGFVAEWTGQDLTIGLPFVPFRNLPLVVVPAVTDITGSAGNGARFILGAGYSFSF
jgi:hypothetical protein